MSQRFRRWFAEFLLACYLAAGLGFPPGLLAEAWFRSQGQRYEPAVWYIGMGGILLAGIYGADVERLRHPARWAVWLTGIGWVINLVLGSWLLAT